MDKNKQFRKPETKISEDKKDKKNLSDALRKNLLRRKASTKNTSH